MKRFLNLPTLLLLAFAPFFFASCESDSEPGTELPPVVTLTSSSDITVEPTEVFTVSFSASKGDSPLKAVRVYEDGTSVPTSRLAFNGTPAAANPILITGTDVDGLTWTVDITAQSSVGTPVVFEIEVQDDLNNTQSVFVNVTAVGTPPTLTTSSPTVFSTGQDIKNAFKLTAVKGIGDLVSIEVTENNQKVNPSNLFWKEISMSVADNPFTLGDEDKDGFEDEDLFIMTPMLAGNFIYKVILTDEFGLTAELEFDVTTFTRVEMLSGVLLNSAGPDGQGGLDLDTGNSTNSIDDAAEIKDDGIDTDLPVDQNWLRTISPANNSQMKYLRAGQNGLSETFTFAGIEYKEDLPGLFDNGLDFADGSSDEVMIEDVFIVERDGKYWVLEVIEIVTDFEMNEDSYTFDVKF
ncbi:MAG: hypothetical protein AAGA77_14640 [Bacteroidota bacterium]